MTDAPTFSLQRMAELEQLVLERWTPEAFRRFQCIWLTSKLDLSTHDIAGALGLNISTVRRIRMEFGRDGIRAIEGKGNRGGRRNQHMTLDEERAFLRDCAGMLEAPGGGGVTALKEALEARLGVSVHKTTVYRLLERHGLRRITSAPRAAVSTAQGRRRKGRKGR